MNGHKVPMIRAPRTLESEARERLEVIEEKAGPIAGRGPFYSRLAGFEEGRPVFAVLSVETGGHALPVALDPFSAQLAAYAATRRAGRSPIVCLITL
jgi:hypothetical protein